MQMYLTKTYTNENYIKLLMVNLVFIIIEKREKVLPKMNNFQEKKKKNLYKQILPKGSTEGIDLGFKGVDVQRKAN